MKKLLDHIPSRLRNRYTATAVGLLCWIAFFDRSDAWTTFKNRRQLGRMEEQKEFYLNEIARTKEQLHELSSDKELLEKFARERYLMKRDNEDIFVLVAEKKDHKVSRPDNK
ncbi:MAG: septum formation initiator family protein [Flavobacteriales bacterium]|nr:septum formation initiator family protein [Flavobacteriales bacterium]